MTNYNYKDTLEEMEKESRTAKWGMEYAKIGDKMDEISEFIANGDVEGKYSAMLVFEEEFVNVSKYAYPDAEGPIFVTVTAKADGTEMIFVDGGIPFNPAEHLDNETDMDRVGGHGIEIIMKYSKEVEYHRLYDMNILRLLV